MRRASDDETAAVPSAAATEHGPLTGLPFSAPKPQASAPEYDVLLEEFHASRPPTPGLPPHDLEKIAALLLWMSQDFQPKLCKKDIHHAVLEAVIKCADAPTGGTPGLLHTTSAAKLSQVIDITMLHKNGSPKDANQTLAFMRSCAAIRDTMLQSVSRYNATERVEMLKTTCPRVISGLVATYSNMNFCHTRKKTIGLGFGINSMATRSSQGFNDPLLTVCFGGLWVIRKWLCSFGNTASRDSLTCQCHARWACYRAAWTSASCGIFLLQTTSLPTRAKKVPTSRCR